MDAELTKQLIKEKEKLVKELEAIENLLDFYRKPGIIKSIEVVKTETPQKVSPKKSVTPSIEEIPDYSNTPKDPEFQCYLKVRPKPINLEQIIYFIKKKNCFIGRNELAELWNSNLPNAVIPSQIKAWISTCLTHELTEKAYFPNLVYYRTNNNKKFTVWGFSEWLGPDGHPLPKYLPKNIQTNED